MANTLFTSEIVSRLNQADPVRASIKLGTLLANAEEDMNTIETDEIADLAVTAAKLGALAVETAKIDNLAVTTGKINALAVTAAELGALAVETAKIDNLAVTAAKIGALAVETAKIDNLAVETGKLALLAVTEAQLGPLAATTAKIDNLAIETGKVALLAITEAQLGPLAATTAKIDNLAVTGGKLAADAVSGADKIADDAVSLEHLDSGCKPVQISIQANSAKTTSREENIDGLSSAITLSNSLQTIMNTHAADGGGALHVTADAVNFPVAGTASDLATLLVQVGLMLTAYDVHDDDSELGAAWAYHDAQEAGDQTPVSVVTPTTLEEAVTRLNDLKSKYNGHDADNTTHTSGSGANQEATGDAAYGTAILVAVTGAASGDIVIWGILDDGTGNVTGVSASAGTNVVTFTFSADPQNDAIISFVALRTAA